MNFLRASYLGMCFGVRDAIRLAARQAAREPITILGELVHNDTVVASLEAQGIHTARDLAELRAPTVLISAHGASDRRLREVRARGFQVVEATCPLVRLAQRAVAALAREGYHPVLIGRRDHVEVRGLTEDLAAFDVVEDEADIEPLTPRLRFGVAAQTTQPIDRVRHLVARLRARFPEAEVKFVDTVCQPTKLRQAAAIELAQQCEVVIVVGGARSNNTRELVGTCAQYGARVHHIQGAADLRPEWVADAQTVGLTAGTSTPDSVIDEVERLLRAWAGDAAPPVGVRPCEEVRHEAAAVLQAI